MYKAVFFIVSLASLAFSAQRALFVQVPPMRYWTAGNPVLVEKDKGIVHQMRDAGGNGWFSFTWENADPSDNVYIYSAKDSLFERPIGFDYYSGKREQDPIPVFMVMEAFGVDSIYYIADDQCWFDDGANQGYYPSDVRSKSLCNGDYDRADSENITIDIHVVFPSYGEWDGETPVIVDADDFGYTREMEPVDSRNFSFSWEGDEWYPKNILIFMKSDSLLEHPIGSKIIYQGGLHSGLQGDYIGADAKESSFSLTDCLLNDLVVYSPTLNPDYKPSCSIYLAPAALIYSIYTENDSLVVPEHRSVDSTEIAYIEGHSLLINKDVPLKNGDYVLKYAFYDYDNKPVEGRLVFTVKDGKSEFSTAVPARKAASQVQVLVSGRDMLISGAKNTPFAVFNSMGQVVARGRLAGSASVALPAPGVYLVKIGNTMRRVKAQ